jgi:hypothetical protein
VHTRLAWILFGLTLACALTQAVLVTMTIDSTGTETAVSSGFPLVTIGTLAGAAVGALIVSAHPRHRVGWLFVLGSLGTQVGLALGAFSIGSLEAGIGTEYAGQLATWFASMLGAPFAVALLSLLFLLVPDGRLLSRRWRWAVVAAVLAELFMVAGVLTVPPSEMSPYTGPDLSVAGAVLVLAGWICLAIGLVSGTIALVLRTRRAVGVQRSQMLLIAAGATILLGGFVLIPVASLATGRDADGYLIVPLMIGYVAVPICTGVAILRYRLYDIDLIVSKAIIVSILGGFIAVGYVALVVLIGRVVDAPVEDRFWPSALATALVALAVQPLRGVVTRIADRAVYGRRAEPYEALAEFSRGLQAKPSVGQLLARVAEAVGRAVSARQATTWVDLPSGSERATWPEEAERPADLVLPVVDHGQELGGLAVAMPRGRALRAGEEKLLADFASQLGRAFRNLVLEGDLAMRVRQLAYQTEELHASRARLLSAQVVERQRLEAAIRREVMPHLIDLPHDIATMRGRAPDRQWNDEVDRMVEETNAALDALRRLTRGVFPAQLAHRGLGPALAARAREIPVADRLRVSDAVAARRFDPRAESVAYFCCVESLRELGDPARLVVDLADGSITVTISGPAGAASRLQHLVDRVEAAGGTVQAIDDRSEMRLLVRIPVGSPGLGAPDGSQRAGAEV